jgi:hypothetical protein
VAVSASALRKKSTVLLLRARIAALFVRDTLSSQCAIGVL